MVGTRLPSGELRGLLRASVEGAAQARKPCGELCGSLWPCPCPAECGQSGHDVIMKEAAGRLQLSRESTCGLCTHELSCRTGEQKCIGCMRA